MSFSFIWWFACWVMAAHAGDGGVGGAASPSVVDVNNEAQFDRLLSDSRPLLVDFYSPSCIHCKRLEPEFNRAAQYVRDAGLAVTLIKVDATRLPTLADRFAVKAYPTLRFFASNPLNDIPYSGPRTSAGISDWLAQRVAAVPPAAPTSPAAAEARAAAEQEAEKHARQAAIEGIAAAIAAAESGGGETAKRQRRSAAASSPTSKPSFLEKAAECERKCTGKRDRLPECDFFCIDSACFRRVWGQLQLMGSPAVTGSEASTAASRDYRARLSDPVKVEQFTHCAKLRLLPAVPQSVASSRVIDRDAQTQALQDWKKKQAKKKAERLAQREQEMLRQQEDRRDLELKKEQQRRQQKRVPPAHDEL